MILADAPRHRRRNPFLRWVRCQVFHRWGNWSWINDIPHDSANAWCNVCRRFA